MAGISCKNINFAVINGAGGCKPPATPSQQAYYTMAQDEKWTEIEHLPEWDEHFYEVYTAKKYGKWVMLKTLRPEFRDDPEYGAMMEKEFDVRYNLSHPNIVMINDFEEVPGLGRCIITDDVYGDSLRKLISEGKVTRKHIDALTGRLVDALEYVQTNHIVHHPLRAERIIFTENIGNLKLIDVGFDQENSLSPDAAAEDIYNFGTILKEAMASANVQDPKLRKIAEKCTATEPRKRYATAFHLHQALEARKANALYLIVIAFLAVMVVLLLLLPKI